MNSDPGIKAAKHGDDISRICGPGVVQWGQMDAAGYREQQASHLSYVLVLQDAEYEVNFPFAVVIKKEAQQPCSFRVVGPFQQSPPAGMILVQPARPQRAGESSPHVGGAHRE